MGLIYRPPNDKLEQFKQSLSEILQKIDLKKKKCYIMGDFNVDLLKVEESRHSNDVFNCTFSSSFYPLISKPTRITSGSATLIDNIFVNSLVYNFTSGLLSTDLSDHLPIFQITISLTQNTTKKTTKHRKITKKTLDLLNQKLECEKWEDIYREENPQHAYTRFYNTLFNAFDKSIPLVNHTNSYHKASQTPWITSYTKNISTIQLE